MTPAGSLVPGNERVLAAGRCASTRWLPDASDDDDVAFDAKPKPKSPTPVTPTHVTLIDSAATASDVEPDVGVDVDVGTDFGVGVGVGASTRRASEAAAAAAELSSEAEAPSGGDRRTTECSSEREPRESESAQTSSRPACEPVEPRPELLTVRASAAGANCDSIDCDLGTLVSSSGVTSLATAPTCTSDEQQSACAVSVAADCGL